MICIVSLRTPSSSTETQGPVEQHCEADEVIQSGGELVVIFTRTEESSPLERARRDGRTQGQAL